MTSSEKGFKNNIINWYPGHMKKASDMINENLKLIDLVIEVLDARIPLSSKNPAVKNISNGKMHLIVLNKSDLVTKSDIDKWVEYYKENGYNVLSLTSTISKERSKILQTLTELSKEKRERDTKRGILNRPLRVMIIGIPNCGKSTLINLIAGKSSAKTANKPGVTKGKQWVRILDNIELLDTPGILWPKIEDEATALKLAFTGAISDNILPLDNVIVNLIKNFIKNNEESLIKYYNINNGNTPEVVLEEIANSRGAIISSQKINYDKLYRLILTDFRKGKFGKICLDNWEFE